MNGKTAKILNRLATITKSRPRTLKRAWKRATHKERGRIRARAKHEIFSNGHRTLEALEAVAKGKRL